jgi:hypothetical protein
MTTTMPSPRPYAPKPTPNGTDSYNRAPKAANLVDPADGTQHRDHDLALRWQETLWPR